MAYKIPKNIVMKIGEDWCHESQSWSHVDKEYDNKGISYKGAEDLEEVQNELMELMVSESKSNFIKIL